MRFITVIVAAFSLLSLGGCGTPQQAFPKVGGPSIQGVIGEGPVSDFDLPRVEQALLDTVKIKQSPNEQSLQILRTAHSDKVSYVLYRTPVSDGLAIVTKEGPAVKIRERIPVSKGDPSQNLITYNTIVTGNPWDPDNGVLFGTVHNPYIKWIEAGFRDATRVRTDVSASRGFILIRPGTDTRFVQLTAGGDGGMFWTRDTR